jgi:nucleoside-diphosphate-sugar epimerase
MQRRLRVLVTGAAGLIGSLLQERLLDRYQLSGVDRTRIRGAGLTTANLSVANLARRGRRTERVFRDVDVVVDLAGVSDFDAPWNVVRDNNLPVTMNVLEAARQSGARRVVYASSNHVTGLYERDDPYARIVQGDIASLDPQLVPLITAGHPIRPDGPYALGKAFGEAAARYYAEEHGLSVICLRIGTCNRTGRPERPRHFATLLTHDDLARLVVAAIEAPDELHFGVFYGVSANTWRFWDISDARETLGYEPQDDAEAWRPGITERG